MRGFKEIGLTYNRLYEKVWYNRHMSGGRPVEGREEARRLEETYGKDALTLDYGDYGVAVGEMRALAWVLGAEWDEAGDT